MEKKPARLVPAGTFLKIEPKPPARVARHRNDPRWDWRNPIDNPSGVKPKPATRKEILGYCEKLREDAKEYDEIGAVDMVDSLGLPWDTRQAILYELVCGNK